MLTLPPAIAFLCPVYLCLALTDLQSFEEPRRNVQKAPAWLEALTFLWNWWILTVCYCGCCCCLRFFLGNTKLSNPPRRFSDVRSRLGLTVSWWVKSSPLSRSQNDHHYLPLAFWRERTSCFHAISSFMGIHSAWSYCFRTGGKMYSFYRFIPSAGICLSGFPCTNTKKALIHADWVGLMPWDVTADGWWHLDRFTQQKLH